MSTEYPKHKNSTARDLNIGQLLIIIQLSVLELEVRRYLLQILKINGKIVCKGNDPDKANVSY